MKKTDHKDLSETGPWKMMLKKKRSEQSFNAAIQRLNKELKSSKKEFEAINEKLFLFNTELQRRNKALKEAKDYSEAIVETIRHPLIVLTEDLKIHDANRAFYKTFDVTPQEAEGQFFHEIIGRQWNKHTLRQLIECNVFSNKIFNEFEVKFNFYNVGERIMVLSARRLIQEDVKATKILIAMEDITQQRKEQQELQQSLEAFEIMAENSPVMIWMADINKNRIYFNNAWLHYTGRSLEQETGHGWEEGIHPSDFERSMEIFNTSFDKRKSYKKEYRLRRRDGQYRWVLSHGVPLFDKGVFSGYIGSCMDINYRVEQEQQKDEFIAVASHELKTPLTSIKVYTELLHQILVDSNDQESALLAARMDTQVDKLTRLIKEMLDVTRITGKTLSLNKEYFDMNELIKEVVADTQLTTDTHNLLPRLKFTGKVLGDRERLRQVLVNFISNAIKYSPEADKVIIRSLKENDQLKISVQDFGIGISPEIQGRIFERFFRAPDPENTFPGIGLGLYISAEIVNRHKGKIWFNSKLAQGSTFCFSLPLPQEEES